MKTIFKILFSGILLANLSCTHSDDGKKNPELDENHRTSIVNKLKYELKTADLLDGFDGSERVLESSVVEIDGKFYLRTVFDNEYTATTLLKYDASNNSLIEDGITCTSKICATSNGCVPDASGVKCSSCGGGIGDCTKTVTYPTN